MVKIRLRRIGTKGRPFYRVVVAQSTAGRNGKFIENIGTYDPLTTPKVISINEERALHWLMSGAQPTETTAYLLNKIGILPKYFEARPAAKKQYDYLDKTTAAISKPSAIGPTGESAKKAETAPVAESTPEPVAPAATEAPVEEAAPEPEAAAEVPAEEPVAEVPAPEAAEEPAPEAPAELPADETAEDTKPEGQ